MRSLNFDNKINFLIREKRDFTLTMSQTSLSISVVGEKKPILFSDTQNSFHFFSFVKKLKENIYENEKRRLLEIHPSECIYNYFNKKFYLNKKEKIYAVDISSCYLSVAKNYGMIDGEIFDSAKKLKKEDRLKIMGMLAYNPVVINYEKGERVSMYRKNSTGNPDYDSDLDFSKNFFFLVRKTDEIFLALMNKLKNDAIFFWVDCIFFRGDYNIRIVQDFLKSKNYESKYFRCALFDTVRADSYTEFSYKKYSYSNKKIEEKKYCLSNEPMAARKKRNDMIRAILSKDFSELKNIYKDKNSYIA